MAGNSKISNLDPAAGLTGTEELPVVQAGETVKTTTQDVADLVTSKDLGTDDLTSADNERRFILNGSLNTSLLTVESLGGVKIAQFRGDDTFYMPTGDLGIGGFPLAGVGQLRLSGTSGRAYGAYIDGSYSVAGVRVLSFTAPNKFTCSNIGGNQVGYNSEGNSAATANRSAHRAYVVGANTASNIGFTCEVSNGLNNYAIDVVSGDIRFGGGVSAGSKIGTLANEKMSFWGAIPIVQPTALTPQLTDLNGDVTPSTPDYALTATNNGWGCGSQDEFETLTSVILNLQTRVQELEDKLSSSSGGSGIIA